MTLTSDEWVRPRDDWPVQFPHQRRETTRGHPLFLAINV
jgi:hypothetical protein